MNYHGNDHNQNRDGSEQHRKRRFLSHGLLMILCCAIILLLLFALTKFNIKSPGLQSVLVMGVFLLCPLMHVVMMFLMNKDKKKIRDHSGDCH